MEGVKREEKIWKSCCGEWDRVHLEGREGLPRSIKGQIEVMQHKFVVDPAVTIL